MNNSIPKIIAIEGNIGSGKSTLVSKLEEIFGTQLKMKMELQF
jgi:deoxyadenosine/deoxycytidine kinase